MLSHPPPSWVVPSLLALTLLSVLSTALLAIHVFLRTRALVDAARRWAGGELSHRLPEGGRGGLSGLATALNLAVARVRAWVQTGELATSEPGGRPDGERTSV